MIKRLILVGLIILTFLSGEAVFAKSVTTERLKKKFPHRVVVNLQETSNEAFFFSFHPSNPNIPFRWHRWKHEKSLPETLIRSSDFSSLFRVAFSPDGKFMLTTAANGEVSIANLKNKKRSSPGTFLNGNDARFRFPAFSPDGKFFFLHDAFSQTLLMVDAETRDIGRAQKFENVWLPEIGGAEIEPFDTISVYEFSNDRRTLTFGKRHVIHLP